MRFVKTTWMDSYSQMDVHYREAKESLTGALEEKKTNNLNSLS